MWAPGRTLTYTSEYSELQLSVSVDGSVVLLVLSSVSSLSSPEFGVIRSILLKTWEAKDHCLRATSKRSLSERAQVSGRRERPEYTIKVWTGEACGKPWQRCAHVTRAKAQGMATYAFLSAELNWQVTFTTSHGLCPRGEIVDGLGFVGLGIRVDLRLLSRSKQQPEREKSYRQKVSDAC